jgi:transcriptional regulator with XRE-family HTH domain
MSPENRKPPTIPFGGIIVRSSTGSRTVEPPIVIESGTVPLERLVARRADMLSASTRVSRRRFNKHRSLRQRIAEEQPEESQSFKQPASSESQTETLRIVANSTTAGEFIRGYREERRISQEDLATKVKISRSTLAQIEKGVRTPPVSVAADIARALRLDSNVTVIADLIICLSKETDRNYVESLFGLAHESDVFVPNSDAFIAEGTTSEKLVEYKRRSGRSNREIARLGGSNYVSVSRFISGKAEKLRADSFVRLVKGLGLGPEQVIDLFYSFGTQSKNHQLKSPGAFRRRTKD